MTQAQNNAFPYITVAETSVPANPSAGNQRLYIDPADHKLKVVNSSGTVTTVDASAISAILTTFALPGDITPSQITADQDDYNPTGLSTASVLRLSSDASRNINGLAGGADGRVLLVHNVGSSNIVIKDEASSSTAANRFALVADITLAADAVCVLQYDSTSSRWRAVSGGGGGSGATNKVLISSSLPSGTGTVTFSSIPAIYKDLEVEVVGRTTAAGASEVGVYVYLNNDTTAANYRSELIQAINAALVGYGSDGSATVVLPPAAAPANSMGVISARILNYANTTFNKQILYNNAIRLDASSSHELLRVCSTEWENTAAVNRIDIVLGSGNFVTGSEIRLYGTLDIPATVQVYTPSPGPLAYAAASGGNYTGLTNNSGADVDATNAKVSFVAPASGKVLVRLTAGCHAGIVGAADILYWGLRENTSDIAGYAMAVRGRIDGSTGLISSPSVAFVITGLTANSAHTYKWAYKVSASGNATMVATTEQPAIMEVWPLT